MTPEGRVKKKLDARLKALDAKGVWYFCPPASPYGRAGIPDRIVIVRGLCVGIEVKADRTKKPTALQLATMRRMENAGARCFVVYDDETIAEAISYIESIADQGD